MSLMPSAQASAARELPQRAIIVLAALALVGAAMLLVGGWLAAGAPPPPPPRNPFGVGPREAAPAANGLGALILSWQASFHREMTASLRAVREAPAAALGLAWLGFAYGAVHAAGPGHGKAVISAYILADDRAVAWRAFGLSLSAALVQALVAIGLVGLFTLVLGATARQMNAASRWIEIASFSAVLLVGLVLLWRKAGVLLAAWRGEAEACAPGCAHDAAMPAPGTRPLRETLGVVLAAGIRPCAGAILILVLSASQGLIWAGIAATLAMALGVALTTGGLAMIAVGAKHVALRLAGGRGNRAAIAVRALECLAAAFVALLGGLLLAGFAAAGAS